MSKAELARQARIDRSHISRIESDEFRSVQPDTLMALSKALNCEPEELTGRVAVRQVTPYESNPEYRRLLDALDRIPGADRAEILRHAVYMAERFEVSIPRMPKADVSMGDLIPFPHAEVGQGGDFPPIPVPDDQFIEKDTDRPRPLHAWVKPVVGQAAAGPPLLADDTVVVPLTDAESALILNSLREVRDPRVQVVKIFGRSMHPTLGNGWKVAIDPARSLFRPGRVVLVYVKDEGTSVGVLEETPAGVQLRKVNREYADIPLLPGEWYPMGTVTVVVEAPVEV